MQNMKLVAFVQVPPTAIPYCDEICFGLRRPLCRSSVVPDRRTEYITVGKFMFDVPLAPTHDQLAVFFRDAGYRSGEIDAVHLNLPAGLGVSMRMQIGDSVADDQPPEALTDNRFNLLVGHPRLTQNLPVVFT